MDMNFWWQHIFMRSKQQTNKSKIIKNILLIIFFSIITFIAIWSIKNNIYTSKENFIKAIENCGIFAPIFFVILETISIVVLFLPCMVGYPAGTILFGPFLSSVYNIISTILGLIIIYIFIKKYGIQILNEFDKNKKYEKYLQKLNNKKFKIFFITSLILPIFPDNLLCYIASLSNINFKTYLKIICFSRPWQIIFYCYGINEIFNILL